MIESFKTVMNTSTKPGIIVYDNRNKMNPQIKCINVN